MAKITDKLISIRDNLVYKASVDNPDLTQPELGLIFGRTAQQISNILAKFKNQED